MPPVPYKGDSARADIMLRCYMTIMALSAKSGITATRLAETLGISRRSVYRYLAAASLVLPIYEIQEAPAHFKLLADDDFPDHWIY